MKKVNPKESVRRWTEYLMTVWREKLSSWMRHAYETFRLRFLDSFWGLKSSSVHHCVCLPNLATWDREIKRIIIIVIIIIEVFFSFFFFLINLIFALNSSLCLLVWPKCTVQNAYPTTVYGPAYNIFFWFWHVT